MLEHDHDPASIKQRISAPNQQSYLKDVVFGAIDGAVTTFAIVAGVVGANLPLKVFQSQLVDRTVMQQQVQTRQNRRRSVRLPHIRPKLFRACRDLRVCHVPKSALSQHPATELCGKLSAGLSQPMVGFRIGM